MQDYIKNNFDKPILEVGMEVYSPEYGNGTVLKTEEWPWRKHPIVFEAAFNKDTEFFYDSYGLYISKENDKNSAYHIASYLPTKLEVEQTEETTQLKPSNPKDLIGSNKIPLHLWPETASLTGALALLDGGLKYGRSNFREIGVRSSIYYDAARRHLNAWFEGEDNDPDSGLPHLGHALACLAILVDAQAAGKLNDDRMVKGGYRALINDLTPHVARLKELHKDKNPRHYTIQDNIDG